MSRPTRRLLVIAFILAAVLSVFASSAPDGLERVLEDAGVADHAATLLPSPVPDYQVPGLGHAGLATALAGLLGTLLTLAVGWGVGRWVSTRRAGERA